MNFHFFTKGDENVASSRYRAYLLAKELKKFTIKPMFLL